MTDQTAPLTATDQDPREPFRFTDADGDYLHIGIPATPASDGPAISFHTPTEPVHVPVELIPGVIAALQRLAATAAAADGPSTSVCGVCSGVVGWVDCPTGGWWAHETHPADEHDAKPTPGDACSAALMPLGSDPVEPCVVHGPHRRHRSLLGQRWTDADAGLAV